MARKVQQIDVENSPTAWFCQLELARDRGDFDVAANAVRKLKRLGVVVRFRGLTAKKLAEAERMLSKQKPTVLAREMSQ